jgi:hypothetical protein
MKRILLIAVFLGMPAVVQAQTTTVQATWTQADPNPATLTYTTQRNATAPVAVTAVTCAGSACQGTVTFTGVTLVSGDSFTLTAKGASGLSSPPSAPFVITGPGQPGGYKIVITITGP